MLVMRILRQSMCWEVFLTQFLTLVSQSAPVKLHIWKRSMWQPSAMWKSQCKYSSVPLLVRCWYLHHYMKPGLVCLILVQTGCFPLISAPCCVPAVPSVSVLGIIYIFCFLLHIFTRQTLSQAFYTFDFVSKKINSWLVLGEDVCYLV